MSDELRDDRTPLPGKPWLVRLTCCGRADGVYAALTWEEADRFRLSYTAPGHYEDVSGLGGGHRRSAVIEDGYAPALAARPDSPTLDVERLARALPLWLLAEDTVLPEAEERQTIARDIARGYVEDGLLAARLSDGVDGLDGRTTRKSGERAPGEPLGDVLGDRGEQFVGSRFVGSGHVDDDLEVGPEAREGRSRHGYKIQRAVDNDNYQARELLRLIYENDRFVDHHDRNVALVIGFIQGIQQRAGLSLDRLTIALKRHDCGGDTTPTACAQAIAREYARLAAEAPERPA